MAEELTAITATKEEEEEEEAPGLVEAFLPEQRLVDGLLFPKVFSPSSYSSASVFLSNQVFLERQLLRHGALFFRGFPWFSPADFNSLVQATAWERLPYVGSAPRTKVVDGVYTANDSNPSVFIPFHHEMAQVTDGCPSKVLFFCETEPAEQGQTPIVVSHKVTEKMWEQFPEFMQKLEELGLLYVKVLPMKMDPSQISLQGWPLVFGTSDRSEAEQRATIQFNARVEWLPGDCLKMISGPFKATRNFDRQGRDAWFNMIVAYCTGATTKTGVSSDQPYDVLFGDNSPLPPNALEGCRRIHEELSVDMPWQKGDLMIVDNFAVMHGRRAYKPPRQVLVALCK